jgi:hypothetical protein
MQHETPPDLRPLPDETATILCTTQALLSELVLGSSLTGLLCNSSVVSRSAGTRDIVEGRLRQSRDILHRKEAELVQVLVGSVGYYCMIRRLGWHEVVDALGRTGYKFSINLVGFSQVLIFISPIGELVHREQVEVLPRGGLSHFHGRGWLPPG